MIAMRNPYTPAVIFGLILGLLLLWLIITDAPIAAALGLREPEVTPSPSWWHWRDEQAPREDMIHYLTYEEVPHEGQE